jgi:hypothetical protein
MLTTLTDVFPTEQGKAYNFVALKPIRIYWAVPTL